MKRLTALLLAFMALPLASVSSVRAQSRSAFNETLDRLLSEGRTAEAEARCNEALANYPQGDQIRFGLAITQLLRGVERGVQRIHEFGIHRSKSLNILGMVGIVIPNPPIERQPRPTSISYDDFRAILQLAISDLRRVDQTLSEIRDPSVKLSLAFGLIRLDLNGDGAALERETLWRLYNGVTGQRVEEATAQRFRIDFDRADVEWLRGYCNLLAGLGEAALAYDQRELFERTGQLLFERVQSPHPYLSHREVNEQSTRATETNEDFMDLIAVIHLINFPIREPERMGRARAHFLAMIGHSRTMWRYVSEEQDNENEWIPGVRQVGVIPGIRFTDEQIAGWHDFLDEAEGLLEGRKLIPFWRSGEPRGVNLKRVFTEPRDFDLVMWMQGTHATPYLEAGVLTKPEVWSRLESLFGGRFIGFAAYIN